MVTGASSGIGREISIKLGKSGVKTGLVARRKNKLEKVKEEIEKNGGEALAVPADLRKEKRVKKAVDKIVKKYNRLDILVNNAGLGIFKEVQDMKVEDWDKQVEVILRGSFLASKFSLPYIYKNKRGHVINITSLWAKRYCAKCSGYTSAKFGLRGFTDSLREEAKSHNVKVTNIMPGTVETPFFEKASWEHDFSKALQPKDIARLIVDILKYPDRANIEEVSIESISPDKRTC